MNQKKLQEAYEAIEELEKLLQERITELNTIGRDVMMAKQAMHAYVLYRKLNWKAKYIIRDLIK